MLVVAEILTMDQNINAIKLFFNIVHITYARVPHI